MCLEGGTLQTVAAIEIKLAWKKWSLVEYQQDELGIKKNILNRR